MEAVRRAVVGLGMGSFVCLLFVFASGGAFLGRDDVAGCFAISVFVGVATLVFSIERLNFAACLALHYVSTMLFIFVLYSFVEPVADFGTMVLTASVLYAVSYGLNFLRELAQARQLNGLIASARAKGEGEAEEG